MTKTQVLRELLTIIRAISKQVNSICEYQKARDNSDHCQIVQPLRVEINPTPQLDPARQEYYDAENRERNSLWEKVKPWLELFGVTVAFALAVFTYLTLDQIKQQTPNVARAAQAASEQTKLIRSAQRPWLGVDGPVRLSIQNFDVSFSPIPYTGTGPIPPEPTFSGVPNRVTLTTEGIITIKNFGTSPAFDANENTVVYVPPRRTRLPDRAGPG